MNTRTTLHLERNKRRAVRWLLRVPPVPGGGGDGDGVEENAQEPSPLYEERALETRRASAVGRGEKSVTRLGYTAMHRSSASDVRLPH